MFADAHKLYVSDAYLLYVSDAYNINREVLAAQRVCNNRKHTRNMLNMLKHAWLHQLFKGIKFVYIRTLVWCWLKPKPERAPEHWCPACA